MPKPTLAIFVDWFSPGYKAGGPIRSVENLAHLLKDSSDIFIFTSDRDAGDDSPYPDLPTDTWTAFQPGIQVWYASPRKHRIMEQELRKLQPDAVYLNSMFSLPFTMFPLRWHGRKSLAPRVVLAPRGMLHAGAIQYGMRKKRLFIRLIRLLGTHKKVVWQATDNQEAADIRQHLGSRSEVQQVGNIPTSDLESTLPGFPSKHPGVAKLLYISRIQPKKNLETLLKSLESVQGTVQLDLVGPVEDEGYWQQCQQHISQLPSNVAVSYLGAMPHYQILDFMKRYHLFALTTHGENFGHAIFDALLCGLPVLLSDQTPWNQVESQQAGWAIPLSHIPKYVRALNEVVAWDQQTFSQYSEQARKFAVHYLQNSHFKRDYFRLLFP